MSQQEDIVAVEQQVDKRNKHQPKEAIASPLLLALPPHTEATYAVKVFGGELGIVEDPQRRPLPALLPPLSFPSRYSIVLGSRPSIHVRSEQRLPEQSQPVKAVNASVMCNANLPNMKFSPHRCAVWKYTNLQYLKHIQSL